MGTFSLTNRYYIVTLVILFLTFYCQPVEGSDRPIVILKSADVEAYNNAAKGVDEVLKEDKTLTYTLDNDPDRIPHVMEKVTLASPKAVIAIGSLATLALRTVPVNAPVVFCLVVNHSEGLEIPKSWAVSMHLPADEAYQRIKEVFPRSRIGIPYNPERTGELVRDFLAYFKDTPIQLIPITVRSAPELGPSLAKTRSEIDALWILPDASFLDPVSVKFLLRYSVSESLPLLGYSEGFSKSGALLSLAGDYEEMGRQAGEIAKRIILGENPSRIQHPRGLRIFVNLQVARRLNIAVGRSLIARAEHVYP